MKVLIGLDFYYSFVRNKIRKGMKGSVAIDSIFDWILCGRYDSDEDNVYSLVNLNKTHCLKAACRVLLEVDKDLKK